MAVRSERFFAFSGALSICEPPSKGSRHPSDSIRQPIQCADGSAGAEGLMEFVQCPERGNEEGHHPKDRASEPPRTQGKEVAQHSERAGMDDLVDRRLDVDL